MSTVIILMHPQCCYVTSVWLLWSLRGVLLIYLDKISICRFSDFIERNSFDCVQPFIGSAILTMSWLRWHQFNGRTNGTANKQSHSTNIGMNTHANSEEESAPLTQCTKFNAVSFCCLHFQWQYRFNFSRFHSICCCIPPYAFTIA